MLIFAFATEALRRRTMAVELDHHLLTTANRLDERVLGGPVPRFPLVRAPRRRIKSRGLERWVAAMVRLPHALLRGSVAIAKKILMLGPGCVGR
jgi:hypothetical protein